LETGKQALKPEFKHAVEIANVKLLQLINIHKWLCANKLSLNVDQSHFVIFHPFQKKLNYNVCLSINNEVLTQKSSL
jgi:hypothetical protein